MSETWKQIPGYEGAYEVSDQGRVRSVDRTTAHGHRRRGLILKLQLTPAGRPIANLRGTSKLVSRLVAQTFLGSPTPEHPLVCHNDGNPQNNRISNLRYDNQLGNCADKHKHGTHQVGSAIGTSLLDEGDVMRMRHLYCLGHSQDALADLFLTSQSNVSCIVRRASWRHLP